jgi:hypothetical protein
MLWLLTVHPRAFLSLATVILLLNFPKRTKTRFFQEGKLLWNLSIETGPFILSSSGLRLSTIAQIFIFRLINWYDFESHGNSKFIASSILFTA